MMEMTYADLSALIRAQVQDALSTAERDGAEKQALYDRISRHVGSFNHENMSLQEMAAHAAEKLSLKLAKGDDPVAALKAYLKGREDGTEPSGMDASPRGPSFLDKYFSGG